MQDATNNTVVARLARVLASLSSSPVATLLYYLGVLVGLVLLYGRGDFSTAGFIYQAF